jgi:hypothetical protein
MILGELIPSTKGRGVEGQKGRRVEGQKGRRAEGQKGRRAEGQKGRILQEVDQIYNSISSRPPASLEESCSLQKLNRAVRRDGGCGSRYCN